jgi:predicted ribosomally synthesized peptide with SipW-like signal peptide
MAGGLVLGVGSAATLAAWTDTEWVWGGSGAGDNIATSVFELEQNTAGDTPVWVNEETAPGGQLSFGLGATDLTPGDTIYAHVQLRAAADSDAGTVTLDGAVDQVAPSDALFAALVYAANSGVTLANCNAAGFATGTTLVAAATPLTTGSGATSITVTAAPDAVTPGTPVDLCFAVTLPDIPANQALQGQEAQPAWAFQAISI